MTRGQSQYSSLLHTEKVPHAERLEMDRELEELVQKFAEGEQSKCNVLPEELVKKIVEGEQSKWNTLPEVLVQKIVDGEQSECNTLLENSVQKIADKEQSECKALPEELVEKIVAMMPYPNIFRMRTLSKAWLSKLSPLSSIADEKERCRVILFQKEVCERSRKWGTFSPVSFCNILGMDYDLAFRNGRNCLPSLSFFPPEMSTHLQDLEGPILCGYKSLQQRTITAGLCISSDLTLFVANVLTRTWKQLPPLPNAERKDVVFWNKLVRDRSLMTYKVIVLTVNFAAARGCSVQTYDSKTGTWNNRYFDEPTNVATFCNPPAYLNGVLYIPNTEVDYMETFHVEEETWEKIALTLSVDHLRNLSQVCLVVCNERLLRIDFVGNFREILRSGFHYGRVMEIDLPSRRVEPINYYTQYRLNGYYNQYRLNSPRTTNIRYVSLHPFTDGNTLFLGSVDQLATYDLKEYKWKWYNFQRMDLDLASLWEIVETGESSAFCFQPGLNPFAEV